MKLISSRKLRTCAIAGGVIFGLVLVFGFMKAAYDHVDPLASWRRLEKTMGPTTREGNTIVVQLERFRSEHGHYPERLDELVPDYLPSFPRPVDGEGFFYELNPWGCTLTFGFWFNEGIDLYPRCTWDSGDSDWHFEG